MRFVIAIVLFVAAFVALGLGIAQRTILQGPDSFTTSVSTGSAPVTVIDSAALRAFPGTQKVTVSGSKDVFLAYGRTSDVLAWIGDASHNTVSFDVKKQKLTSKLTTGTEDSVPKANGSDLWLQEYSGSNELTRRLNAPSGISAIVLADGRDAAPKQVTITWPLDNSAPLAGPLIIGGIFALLLGLAAFIWALVHARRRRGPRRKQPRLPKAPPTPRLKRGRQAKEIAAGPGALEQSVGTTPGRGRRNRVVLGSALLVASLALAGCTTGAAGGAAPSQSPTPTDSSQKPPDVTEQQLAGIVHKIVATVAEADKKGDAKLLATRFDGPALALRTAGYAVHKADATLVSPAAIPDGTVRITLPQQTDTWPRTALAVMVPPDATAAPLAMVLVQDNARDNYKVHFLVSLEPDTDFPKVAPPQIGAGNLPPENALGLLAPNQIADAYGDILVNDKASASADAFDATGDSLRTSLGKAYKDKKKADLPSSATIVFSHTVPDEPPVSFATNDSGQLVTVTLNEIETVKPVEAGAAVNTQGAVKALSGHKGSTKGIVSTYGLQLLFYVPSVTDTGAKIKLLGFAQGLIAASEVP